MLEHADKPYEVVCYHCAQAIEKLLKGFLIYHNILPAKTHNLIKLLEKCIEIDQRFDAFFDDFDFLNDVNNEVRYPDWIDLTDDFVIKSINIVERFIDFKPIKDLNYNSECTEGE